MSAPELSAEEARIVAAFDAADPAPESFTWTCICGSGDDGEWHTFMCAASNTPDDVFFGDEP